MNGGRDDDRAAEPEQLVEHFFRREYAGLVALLARRFGFALIDVIEDMVQEALAEALRTWRFRGAPDNPAAWLYRVAQNRVIDALRRDRTHSAALEELSLRAESNAAATETESPGVPLEDIDDSLLRMIFTCCHPSLDRGSQLALTLKVLCGFGDHEIARGLLISAAAAKKRVTRAKRRLQLNQVQLQLPGPALLNERLDAVHDVLYLMFNEGYHATRGDVAVRLDLCEEAARLCHLLCVSDLGRPPTRALLALMLFHAARFDARIGKDGVAVLLADQDRSLWDRDMMRVAEYWLARSAEGSDVSRFHLEAGIARLHCQAASIEETRWTDILRHYELLDRLFPSPVYQLNQAVVLGRLNRSSEGVQLLQSLQLEQSLRDYPLWHCALADLLEREGRGVDAVSHWRAARELVKSDHERTLLDGRIAAIGMSDGGGCG